MGKSRITRPFFAIGNKEEDKLKAEFAKFLFQRDANMSKRENIASDIITKLDAVTSPIEFKKLLENLLRLRN